MIACKTIFANIQAGLYDTKVNKTFEKTYKSHVDKVAFKVEHTPKHMLISISINPSVYLHQQLLKSH